MPFLRKYNPALITHCSIPLSKKQHMLKGDRHVGIMALATFELILDAC